MTFSDGRNYRDVNGHKRSKAEFESLKKKNLFIYLAVLGLSCNTLDLSCGIVGSSFMTRDGT